MKPLIWIFVVLLVILHHDFWNWNNDALVFGFMPIGMAYHVGISLAAATVWLLAVTFAWPSDLGDEEDETLDASDSTNRELS